MSRLRSQFVKLACALCFSGMLAPGLSLAEAGSVLNADTNVGVLIDDPRTLVIIDKHIPGMSTSPEITIARYMTLRDLVPISSGRVTEEMLKAIEADLRNLKPE